MDNFPKNLESIEGINGFEEYFESRVKPNLKDLEVFRKAQLEKMKIRRIVFYVAAVLAVLWVSTFKIQAGLDIWIMAFGVLSFPPIVVLAIIFTWMRWPMMQFNRSARGYMIEALMNFLGPAFSHSSLQNLEVKPINDSGVLSETTVILALDRIVGNYKGIDFGLSQILAFKDRGQLTEFDMRDVKSNFGSYDDFAPIGHMLMGKKGFGGGFAGKIFEAEVHKRFKGRIAIRTRAWDKLWRTMDMEDVDLESQEFNRKFKVQSDDQVEARYMLTPDIMHNLLRLEALAGGRFSMAFHGQSMVVAIPDSRDFFRGVDIGTSVYETGRIKELFETIYLFVGIIDHLKLDHAVDMDEVARV